MRTAARLLRGHPIVLDYEAPDETHDRWGWGAASNEALAGLLRGHGDAYRRTIALIESYGQDLARIARHDPEAGQPSWGRDVFSGIDAATLYSFIRQRQPDRYYEVGSGNSTLFAARAIADGKLSTRIVSIDPHPMVAVDLVCDQVVRAPLQRSGTELLCAARPGDVVLMDGSHYVLKNSDVVAFFLDVLPSLASGVLVGVHDIFLPDDYPWWLDGRWFSEQYLLGAWLLGAAERAELLFASHYCATEPSLRGELDAAWERAGIPALAYGSLLWFET